MIHALLLFSSPLLLAQTAQDAEQFETKVRPVLARNCFACHGEEKQFSGLRVDSREALLRGGKRGPAVVPGDDSSSLLLRAMRHSGDLKMPSGGAKLKDADIAPIAEWVKKGAPWPAVTVRKTSAQEDNYRRLARTHWAFQPVKTGLSVSIDEHIAAKLRAANLRASFKPADKRTLLRRLTYVLTGLPPTNEDVERFVNGGSYEAEVDRLLGSPQFGEQWARHWMDLARYGETRGYEWNYEILGAWRYRDYLVRAFQADVPYDQLIREHIAGDLLAKPRINAAEQLNESVIGPAFFRLGEAGHDDCIAFREIATDVIDNQIDTLTKTFQGMTVSCARCHNHKLDPIPTEDYYGLYSILNSSQQVTQTIDAPSVNADKIAKLRALKNDLRAEMAKLWTEDIRGHQWRSALAAKAEKLEDPGYIAANIADWSKLQSQYKEEAAKREAAWKSDYQVLPLEQWTASGMGLRNGMSPSGSFTVGAEGDAVISGVYPRGFYTNLESNRLNGALRLPALPRKKFLSLRVMGGMLGSHRVIIDNCAIGEGYKILDSDSLSWRKTDISKNKDGLPSSIELITRFDNPRIPDRPGVLKGKQVPMMEVPRSYFGIVQAVAHDTEESPREDLRFLLPLLDGPADQLDSRYESILLAAVTRWSNGSSTDEDASWISWLLSRKALRNEPAASPMVQRLIAEYRAVEASISAPRVTEGLADIGDGRDFPVFLSGNPKSFGPAAPRRHLRYLFGDEPLATHGSGRMELAELIASPKNPLTARVMVNRIWHHVFGQGLVRSVDNFGLIGDRPSHPELLDALATQFIADGWSMKKTIRRMVLSNTFRQSSETEAAALETDPQNALLHHYPLRRLTAEELRDSILMSSGTLQKPPSGGSVDPWRPEPQAYRRLFTGPLDGEGRRSLYLKVTRMEGTRFLETFDYPSPMTTRGSRDVTNVPAQALALLNDPFVVQQAERLGQRVLSASQENFEQRLETLFRFTLCRHPSDAERQRFRALADQLGALDEKERWKHLAHAMFNMKEFLYIP